MPVRTRLFAATIGLGLLAAACGSPVDTLATVNGAEIALTDVRMLRIAYEDDEIDATTDQFRADLTFVIRQRLFVDTAASQFGVSFSDEDVTAWLAFVPSRYASEVQGMRSNADITEHAIRVVAEDHMARDAVTEALIVREGFLAATLEAMPEAFTVACVSHILVATSAEADAALARIEAGEDFAAVAIELSSDAGSAANGGRLASGPDCLLDLSVFVAPFASAAAIATIGVATGPVQTEFGFHVIRVDGRQGPPSLAELEADAGSYVDLAFDSLYGPWAQDLLTGADVDMHPLVGTWSSDTGRVTPPDA